MRSRAFVWQWATHSGSLSLSAAWPEVTVTTATLRRSLTLRMAIAIRSTLAGMKILQRNMKPA